MNFEWDDEKSRANKEKHGVSFEKAQVIWEKPHLENKEIARSFQEQRYATIGWVGRELHVVIWTQRAENIRIISVRRARKHEEELYNESVQNNPGDG